MQRLFLILTACLFLIWTSWLAYQVATEADPIVVSRPQVEIAEIIIVADVDTPANQKAKITVKQIIKGKLLNKGEVPFTVEWPDLICGWQGPGTYLLTLTKNGDKLEPIPLSPGFGGLRHTDFQGRQKTTVLIDHIVYPWTESVKKQVEMIVAAKEN
jgi:hypothetical protein